MAGMNIRCEKCRARYRLNVTMFKGSRGMVVRCRRCGKSILVWKPEEIASDTSVLGDVASEGGHSSRGGTEPAVFPGEEEYSFPPEGEQVPSIVLHPILLNSPPKDRLGPTFKWPSIIAFALLVILLVGGTVSLVFPLLGKRMLADIGQRIEEVRTIFRS